jgi:hypothetical protein
MRRVVSALSDHGCDPRPAGEGFSAKCPGHDDRSPSLSVDEGTDGRALVRCHAGDGCPLEDIIGPLGLTVADLFVGEVERANGRRKLVATYDYVDETGTLLFQTVRYDPKDFRQRRPDGRGGWVWKLDGVRRVLYRLPDVVTAVENGRTVWCVEGEKDADSVVRAGEVATCSPMGAGKWRTDYAEALAGAIEVIVVADRDDKGRAHAAAVFASLRARVKDLILCEPRHGKDVTEHLAAGLSLDDLVLIDHATEAREGVTEDLPSHPPPIENGAALLGELADFLGRFVVFPSEHHRDAVALWTIHSHALDAFESTPRLALVSPEKQSGKTRTEELLELVCPRARHASSLTAAALFRLVATERPTLLFDEVDTIFGPGASQHEELRGLLNAGHRRGAVAYRCVGDPANMRVESFPAFAAVALAGIGDLPDTIVDRAVVIPMRRRSPDEPIESFRSRYVTPVANTLHDRLAAWTASVFEDLGRSEPAMPPGVTDRPADCWEPLLAVADIAGGDWPERARRAAVALVAERKVADTSLGSRLLSDCRDLFGDRERMRTADLVNALCALEESPWGDLRGKALDARGLARRLRRFDIRPNDHRFTEGTAKGYLRSDFVDAWRRYLPLTQELATNATRATRASDSDAPTSDVAPVAFVAHVGRQKGNVAHREGTKAPLLATFGPTPTPDDEAPPPSEADLARMFAPDDNSKIPTDEPTPEEEPTESEAREMLTAACLVPKRLQA